MISFPKLHNCRQHRLLDVANSSTAIAFLFASAYIVGFRLSRSHSLKKRTWSDIMTQATLTKGESRSPIRLNFQQNPTNPSRSSCARLFSLGLPASKIVGRSSRKYVQVQIIKVSSSSMDEKLNIANMVE
uniref:Uncharacterized protein n=1 Tax=Craspedostauros australis TaxID=1486917 RepID=A0A7R9ZPB6_9STRA